MGFKCPDCWGYLIKLYVNNTYKGQARWKKIPLNHLRYCRKCKFVWGLKKDGTFNE